MTPPALTIEQLVDALVDKTWWCAQAGKSEVDAAKAECKAARAAILAAIRSQVPADLRATLIDLADDLLDVPIGGPASPTVARIRAVAARLREVATSLPAKKVQVPADLAGLLREQADALAVLDSIRIDDDGRWATSDEVDRVAVVTKRITEWTRANLKETP